MVTIKQGQKEDARIVKNYFTFLRLGSFVSNALGNSQNHNR